VPRRIGPSRDRGPAASGSQLVVIGSSAGGIEALSKVVAGLPADFPAPIVIAQHLDPRRQSHLGEILARHTSLELRIVEEAAALEDGVIFVVPSNHHVEVTDHHITLGAREANESAPSVDRLLLSAAETYGPSLIAVILTGSGSDGTAGARAVNAAGGTVVIENPKTAAFPSMPGSLPATIVDVVADLDAIGELLGKLVTTGAVVESVDEDSLEALLSRLRQRSGIDFAKYKRPTILRRLQTRMAATNQPSLATYGRLVAQDQAEYDRLISSLLIKVTEFFRDTKVWTYLADRVLPGLVEDARHDGRELRLWSAGCSTGEEAYSLALLAAAAVEDKRISEGIRIFATDVDADAIAFARRGHYPESALDGFPARLRKRYLTDLTGDLEIAKHVRDMVVFGEHDLGERAPFPRIDLVLCRNVLIYFTPAMQRAALETFAFSLRADGALVLGSSETTAALPEPFTEEEARLRVYRRSAASPRARLIARPTPNRPAKRQPEETSLERAIGATRRDVGRRPERTEAVEKVLLELSVGVVVIDRRYDIERINGAARRLLGIHGIAFDQDFITSPSPCRPPPCARRSTRRWLGRPPRTCSKLT